MNLKTQKEVDLYNQLQEAFKLLKELQEAEYELKFSLAFKIDNFINKIEN